MTKEEQLQEIRSAIESLEKLEGSDISLEAYQLIMIARTQCDEAEETLKREH